MHDIVRDTLAEWVKHLPLALGLAVLAASFLFIEVRLLPRMAEEKRRWIHLTLVGAAAAIGLTLAWRVLWLADDAFIAFVHSRNFAEGHGLNFIPGERVEGYTNFLWTFLVGLAGKVGMSIPHTALFGNLATFVGALAITAAMVRRTSPGAPGIPFATLALAGSFAFSTFASSGLETMPVAMLVAAGMWGSADTRRGPLLAGLFFTLAIMCRPDQVVMYGCMGLALVLEDLIHNRERPFLQRLDFRRYFAYAAPMFVLFLPWFLMRWSYYGQFYPNTFYAKSGAGSYFSQGLLYGMQFFMTSGAFVWLLAFLFAMWGPARNRNETRLRIFGSLALVLFSFYIVKVGGDFMQHRFFIPLMPVLFGVGEMGMRWRMSEMRMPAFRGVGLGLAGIALVAAVLPVQIIHGWQFRWWLAAEHNYYRVKTLFPLDIASGFWTTGNKMYEAFTANGVQPRFATNCVGMIAWNSRIPIVDMYGLTNRNIAHKEVTTRARPGHEKLANLEEILRENAVVAFETHDGPMFADESRATVKGFTFHFLRWDQELADTLSKVPGSRLPKPEADVKRIATESSRAHAVEALRFYKRFLEFHPKRDEWIGILEARAGSVQEFEETESVGVRVEGDGLRVELIKEPHAIPVGASGRGWFTSLPDKGTGTGRAIIDVGTIEKPELRFALGGAVSEEIRIELVVDGDPVLTAHPEGTTHLVPMAWDVSPWVGKQAELHVIDDEPGTGLGLWLDGIHWPGVPDTREQVAAEGMAPRATVAALHDARGVLPTGSFQLPEGWTHWSFDEKFPKGTRLEGSAFGRKPAEGPLPWQGTVYGAIGGGHVSSYHGGDRGTGKVELPEIDLPTGGIHLLVAGGKDCSKTFVGLEIDGRVTSKVCGKNDERFRPAILRTFSNAGKRGRIVIVDESTEGWGHIMVDEIYLPPASSTGDVVRRSGLELPQSLPVRSLQIGSPKELKFAAPKVKAP